MMIPAIKTLTEKKLVGKRLSMSYADNKTGELWRSFMPVHKSISNTTGPERYSLQVYDTAPYEKEFTAATPFEKWAAMSVADFNNIPEGMEAFTLAGGLYAVFFYKGPMSDGPKVFQYIYGTWLPSSGYVPDNRPQFEVLGDKYSNTAPDSEEEIWIPIKPKN